MGNVPTMQQQKTKSLSQIIDYIATNYILTQNFQDMKNLSDTNYCNNLVILTSKIIAENLNNMDVKFLAQRIKQGVETNEMTKERIIYLNKNNLDNLDVPNKTQKRRLCIGIAKFYVKIAHLFAAIVTTINPSFTYKDSYGGQKEVSLLEKQSLPSDAQTTIKRINLCSRRLNALVNNQDFNVSRDENVSIKPNFCYLNYDNKSGKEKTFLNEPGIPELEKLYYDKYDYDAGGFTGMTDKTRKEVYEKDVETFYKIFTGNTEIPKDALGNSKIRSFKDIPLRDFHKSKGCTKDGVYNRSYTGKLKNKLFSQYADHIKSMMQTTEINQNKLINVLDKLFVIVLNPNTKKKETIINPNLNEKQLQELVDIARNVIVEMYVKCEDDFIKGLQIFEAIVEKQIMDTSQKQIKNLEQTIQETISDSPSRTSSSVATTEKKEPTAQPTISIDQQNLANIKKQLSVEQPLVQQSLAQQPLAQQPLAQQPLAQQSLAQQPLVQQPLAQQPLVQQPLVQQPLAE
jgi:hypothetical protein